MTRVCMCVLLAHFFIKVATANGSVAEPQLKSPWQQQPLLEVKQCHSFFWATRDTPPIHQNMNALCHFSFIHQVCSISWTFSQWLYIVPVIDVFLTSKNNNSITLPGKGCPLQYQLKFNIMHDAKLISLVCSLPSTHFLISQQFTHYPHPHDYLITLKHLFAYYTVERQLTIPHLSCIWGTVQTKFMFQYHSSTFLLAIWCL